MRVHALVQSSDDVLVVLAAHKQEYQRRYGVQRLGLFGSWVRNEHTSHSEIDIVVEFAVPTFDRYFDLKFALEAELGHPVDLVLEQTIKQHLRPVIVREVIYAA